VTGYAMAFGFCCRCGRLFGFNPMKVPSLRIDGVREPVCEHCFHIINAMREKLGLPLNVLQPDAYEPCAESEIELE